MAIKLNDLRHPLQGGRSQLASWAKPDSSWNEIALEARDSAYYITTISLTDNEGKSSSVKVEGILGFSPNGAPVLFGKRSVEHLLTDERQVLNVTWNTKQEKSRAGITYTTGWFEQA